MQSAEAATPGADVGDAGELEQPLHGAVLAERAVQHREHDVDGAERLCRLRVREHGQTSRTRCLVTSSLLGASSAQWPSRPIAICVTS